MVSYDTGAGLTIGMPTKKGVGQGDTNDPVRSMHTIAAAAQGGRSAGARVPL